MRSVSVLELCLLAFLCLSMNALRLSVRDMAFGIALGFGLMSTSDFILSSWISRITSVNAPVQFVYEVADAGRAGHLDGLLLRARAGPQAGADAGELDHLPVERDRHRAGPHGNKVAVQQPANSFFLSDVERVVEKVLARNMKGENRRHERQEIGIRKQEIEKENATARPWPFCSSPGFAGSQNLTTS